jgi:hypothetical protein
MSDIAQDPTQAAPSQAGSASPIQLVAQRVSGADWDMIVSGFDDLCQEQLHAFASTRWPGVEQEPVVFLSDGQVVGGALVMVQPLPLRLGQIAVVKWAPMLANSVRSDAEPLRAAMVARLAEDYANKRGMMVSVLLHASVGERNGGYVALRALGFARGSSLLYPNRYLVNLRLGDAAQRSSFQQAWRRQLSKAERAGLEFRRAGSDEIGAFKRLYDAMTERKQFPDHSAYETLDALMALDEPLRPELFFVMHEGRDVAGALVFKAGKRAVYLYGATNELALPLRAGYFLHWQIIRWLRDHTRADWYDLGGTDGFQGLHQFKKGMVGAAGVIRPVPPVLNFSTNPRARLTGTLAFGARDAVHHLRRHLDALSKSKAKPDQAPHVWEDYLK